MLLDQAKIGWLTYNYMYFPIQRAPHVHNNTTIQKDAHQKLIMICCVRICLNKRKSFLPEVFFKMFLSGEAKVLEGCSVFGVQNPLSPGLMAAKGGKCLHPSFALPPLFYFFIFHFLFQLLMETQISNSFTHLQLN